MYQVFRISGLEHSNAVSGSSTVINVPRGGGRGQRGGLCTCWAGLYWDSLYLLLAFAGTLKLLEKTVLYKKNVRDKKSVCPSNRQHHSKYPSEWQDCPGREPLVETPGSRPGANCPFQLWPLFTSLASGEENPQPCGPAWERKRFLSP